MNRFEELRRTLESKLDQVKAQLNAFENQLRLETGRAVDELEARKRSVEKEARELQSQVEQWTRVDPSTKTKLRASFDHLRVQLALGAAETRDAIEAQSRELDQAVRSFEADLDRAIEEASAQSDPALEQLQRRFLNATHALRAEQEALMLRFEQGGARAKAEFEKHRKELGAQIQDLKENVEAKQRQASDKLTEFTEELSTGMSKIREAFSNLFR